MQKKKIIRHDNNKIHFLPLQFTILNTYKFENNFKSNKLNYEI